MFLPGDRGRGGWAAGQDEHHFNEINQDGDETSVDKEPGVPHRQVEGLLLLLLILSFLLITLNPTPHIFTHQDMPSPAHNLIS